jgi:hypothetical protein
MAASPLLRKPSRESRLKALMEAAKRAAHATSPPKPEHA